MDKLHLKLNEFKLKLKSSSSKLKSIFGKNTEKQVPEIPTTASQVTLSVQQEVKEVGGTIEKETVEVSQIVGEKIEVVLEKVPEGKVKEEAREIVAQVKDALPQIPVAEAPAAQVVVEEKIEKDVVEAPVVA